MDFLNNPKELVRNLSPADLVQFKKKLIDRIQAISKGGLSEGSLEDLTFQDLCFLLENIEDEEELAKIPPWTAECVQRSVSTTKEFRVFVTPRAYDLISKPYDEFTQNVFNKAVKMASGESGVFPDRHRYNGCGHSCADSPLNLEASWLSPTSEVFILLYISIKGYKYCDPHLRFFHPREPEKMEEFFERCLEISVT